MDDKIKALAKYLGISPKEISEGYDDNHFETEDGEEYIVCDYDTALELAEEDVKEVYDDLGMEAFTSNYRDYIFDNLVDEKKLDDMLYDFIEEYYNDAYDEEILEYAEGHGMIDSVYDYDGDIDELRQKLIDADYENYEDNPSEYFKQFMNEKEYSEFIVEHDLIDLDDLARDCVMTDGIAHFIASYDEKEIDLGNDLLAYRVN